LGIQEHDLIVATSATAGGLVWSHNSAEGVKSALSTRFVMSNTVTMRFERKLESIDPSLVSKLKVPFYSTVKLKRPIGLHVVEGPDKAVYVQYIKPNLGAARSKRVEIGDQIVAMSASWGDRLWEVHSVESFVVGVKMRTDSHLSFRLKRLVPFQVYTGQLVTRKHRRNNGISNAPTNRANDVMNNNNSYTSGDDDEEDDFISKNLSLAQRIEQARTLSVLTQLKEQILLNHLPVHSREQGTEPFTEFLTNKFMIKALQLEAPQLAVDLFESAFGFRYHPVNPAGEAVKLFRQSAEDSSTTSWSDVAAKGATASNDSSDSVGDSNNNGGGYLKANNFVCTTAVKAYGRINGCDKAMQVLPWMEAQGETADVYFMSALLYVCAKSKRVREAERIFWQDIPSRKLTYSAATVNSLMYMYARLNRADDALRVYELMKEIGLKCTVVTYGVLIKALMRSGKKKLQETAFEILRSLPKLGINPGVQVYNQIFEYYASTHDYRQTKAVLRLMAQARPRVKPDAVSYGYLVQCFADAKKPRSALSAFRQMRNQRIPASSHTYMGVLKALAHMRDGVSAVQVIREMHEVGIKPDKKHYSMAMFACVTANQCSLAESIIALYLRRHQTKPDTVLCTLWLRALLQQGKWNDGDVLLKKMIAGREFGKPNQQTYNYLLQFQILAEKWPEATATLETILSRYSSSLTRIGMDGSMRGTFAALSFSLGMYSSAVTRRFREDYSMGLPSYGQQQQLPVSSSSESGSEENEANLDASGNSPAGERQSSAVLDAGDDSIDDDLDVFNSNALDTALTTSSGRISNSNSNAVSPSVPAAPLPEQRTAANPEGTSETEVLGGALYLEGRVAKPSEESLKFAVSAMELISEYDNIFVTGTFYIELLKALILEGYPISAQRLLDLKARDGVRMRAEDDAQLMNIEALARRAIESGLIGGGDPSSNKVAKASPSSGSSSGRAQTTLNLNADKPPPPPASAANGDAGAS